MGLFECMYCTFASTSEDRLGEHLRECTLSPSYDPRYKAESMPARSHPLIDAKLRQDMIYFLGQLDALYFWVIDNNNAQSDFLEALSRQYKAIINQILGTHFE